MPSRATVVIPAYNAAATIARPLESIWRAADEAARRLPGLRPEDIAVIVVDDASSDGTAEAVRHVAERQRRPVRYLRQPENRGPSAARNLGAAHSDAEVLFFLDADDDYRPEHLWLCLALLQRFPFVDAVRTGLVVDVDIQDHWYRALVRTLPMNLCVRTTMHRFIGGFDEELRLTEDAEYATRLAALASVLTVERRTVHYRLRPGNALDRQRDLWQAAPGTMASPRPEGFEAMLAAARERHDQAVHRCLARLPDGKARTVTLSLTGSDADLETLALSNLRLEARLGTRGLR